MHSVYATCPHYLCIPLPRHSQQSQMFFGGDYSQFLEPPSDPFPSPTKPTYAQRPPLYIPNPILASHLDDQVYSEFTKTIGKQLCCSAYPPDFKHHNPYCPLCLKLVCKEHPFSTCSLSNDRNYLIHLACLEKDKAYPLRSITEHQDLSPIIQELTQDSKKKFQLALDSSTFYVEVRLLHPIHDKTFFKVQKKIGLSSNQFLIPFHQHQYDSYYPNLVLLPLIDFHIQVTIVQLANHKHNDTQSHNHNSHKYIKYLSLRPCLKYTKARLHCEDLTLDVEVITDLKDQQAAISNMNYKYQLAIDSRIPLVRIHSLAIQLPTNFEQSDDDEDYIVGSSSTIVELLKEQQHSVSTIKSSSVSPFKPRPISSDSNHSNQDPRNDLEDLNLQELIASKGLIEFVKNNGQSRTFQKYLEECGQNEIEAILAQLEGSLPELIMHEYANYMVQKLFKVCSPAQRQAILQSIMPCLGELVKNKQGTHTMQSFISHFSTYEEYTLVALQLRQHYYQLCTNNNGTHFIQKVVKTFPEHFTLPFFSYTVQHLLSFALDKNAMCVIKHIMRRFRELEGHNTCSEAEISELETIRRQLITQVTFNVDRLIMDSYGNYVIQFCYQLFELDKCAAITERILSRFAFYAIGKYSSNVILKCISIYWTDPTIYSSLKTPPNQVQDTFRNKDGNKVLLEIMEKLQGIDLWDRLYSILIRLEPTRFYHDRWGVCLGSRSGQVGARFSSFPEPHRKNYYNRK